MDSSLYNSYELKFLKSIITKSKDGDSAGFQEECLKLKSRSTLDKQKERMLAEILDKLKPAKKGIESEEFNPL